MGDVIWNPGDASNENHLQGTRYTRICEPKILGIFSLSSSLHYETITLFNFPADRVSSITWYANR